MALLGTAKAGLSWASLSITLHGNGLAALSIAKAGPCMAGHRKGVAPHGNARQGGTWLGEGMAILYYARLSQAMA